MHIPAETNTALTATPSLALDVSEWLAKVPNNVALRQTIYTAGDTKRFAAKYHGEVMPFKVFVDDNFHYQDESERYELGEYDSFEAAVATCKTIVDQYLTSAFKEGMTAAELYHSYVTFGEDPFVAPKPEGADFSAWAYAKQRCSEICDTT